MRVEYCVHLACHCMCHWDRTKPLITYHGVDIAKDVEMTGGVETVTACDSCIDGHCSALLLTRLANDPAPERHEKFDWVDPPQQPEPPQPPSVGDASGDDGN